MKKLIFIISILSVISCGNRYSEWKKITYKLENGNDFEKVLDKFEDTTSHIAELVFLNVDQLKLKDYSSNVLNEYIIIKYCIDKEEYGEALKLIQDFPDLLSFSDENGFFIKFNLYLLKAHVLDQLDLRLEMKETLDQLYKMSLGSDIEPYCFAKISLLEANYYKSVNKYLESLSSIHLGLHKLEMSPLNYPKLKQELLCKKAAILIERFDNDEDVAERILDDVLQNPSNTENYIEALSNLIFVGGRLDKHKKVDSLITIGIEKFDALEVDQKNYLSISIISYYLVENQPEKVLSHIDNFPNKYFHNCEKNKFVFELYLTSALLDLDKIGSSKEHLKKVSVPENCPSRTKDIIKFYKEYQHISIASKEGDLEKELRLLLNQRRLAQKLYDSEFDLHLDNYYASNLESIFENLLIQFESAIPENYWADILQLYSSSKNRQININTQKGLLFGVANNTKIDSLSAIIKSGLSASNDFTNLKDYKESYYHDLYHAVNDFNSWAQPKYDQLKVNDSDSENLEEIIQTLKNNDFALLCFLEGFEKYWMLFFDGERMQIRNADKVYVDKLHDKTIMAINNKSLANPILSDSIFDKYIYDYSELIIIPDGKFSFLPFDLNGNKYTTTHSINSITDRAGELNSSKSILLSFSDTITRKGQVKQKIGELYNDYEECDSIHQILGRNSTFFHGAQFNFENLSNSSGLDLLHISSHGGCSLENRFKSYLYLRKNGLPCPIYLNELYELKETPVFVNLSLCNSGIGKNMLGAGTYSLSRPFFENGTKTVLKTLWKTDDEGSKLFMSKFYSNWMNGLEVSEALFQTKQEMRQLEKYKMPYYWAGYVLEGNGKFYLKN